MAKKAAPRTVPYFLQGSTAAALFLLGLVGIVYYNSDLARLGRGVARALGGRDDTLDLIIAILVLVAGILLALDMFYRLPSSGLIALVIFILWAARIVYVWFIHTEAFQPTFLAWLQALSPEVVILAALWMVYRARA
jgi:hypothetical protein